MELELYKHQQELVDLNPYKYLLPWETGTGKTYGLVALIKKNNHFNEPVLIVTIKSDKDKWCGVVEKYGLNGVVMTKEEFRKAATKQVIKKVFKENQMEMVNVKKTVPAPEQMRKYDYVIIDEAHFFTGKTSMMQKSMMAYLKLNDPTYLWLATATPCDDNPWKLFYLGNMLGHNWSYSRFQNHFFAIAGNSRKRFPVKRKTINGRPVEKEVAAYINFLGKAWKIDDCVDMPPKILIEEYFEMTSEQKKAYRGVDEELVLTRNLKRHQICGGTLHDAEKDLTTGEMIRDENLRFASQKLNRAVELCEEHKKIFFVCKYQNEVDYLFETFRKKFPDRDVITFTGKNSADRPSVAKSTDTMQDCIIIANAACSAAYETRTVPLMVFYSYDFSLTNYIQMIGRVRRAPEPGNPRPEDKTPRTYLSLIVKGTIDEDVFECIQNKKDFDAAIYHK
jgi:hypothetical protein